jgi:hypothetical protein
MKSRRKKSKEPVIKPAKPIKNPAFNDSETSTRKVTPSMTPEEKPSPKIKILSLGLNNTPKIPPKPVAAPARRLMRVNVSKLILA